MRGIGGLLTGRALTTFASAMTVALTVSLLAAGGGVLRSDDIRMMLKGAGFAIVDLGMFVVSNASSSRPWSQQEGSAVSPPSCHGG